MARTPVRMMPPRSTSAREADITGLRVAACRGRAAIPATRWLDSCANPKQAGILRRWPQRCTVARYRTAPPWRFAGLQIIALQARRMLVSALRRHASAPSPIAPVAHDAAA